MLLVIFFIFGSSLIYSSPIVFIACQFLVLFIIHFQIIFTFTIHPGIVYDWNWDEANLCSKGSKMRLKHWFGNFYLKFVEIKGLTFSWLSVWLNILDNVKYTIKDWNQWRILLKTALWISKKVWQQKMLSLKLITLAIFKRFWQICAALNCGKIANLTFFPITNGDI